MLGGGGSVAIIVKGPWLDYRIPVHFHLTSESCHHSPTVVYNLHAIFIYLFLPIIICKNPTLPRLSLRAGGRESPPATTIVVPG